MSDHLDVEIRGRVMTIAIRRPAKRNAVDRSVADGIDDTLNRLDDDPEATTQICGSVS